MNDIADIKNRNTRVEVDKAWEQSLTRRRIIALGTYVIIGGYLEYLGVNQAWLHAAVPGTIRRGTIAVRRLAF